MIGQMSIFDLMTFPDFRETENEKTVQLIGNALGVCFKKDREYWEAKKGKLKLRIDFSRYVVNEYHPEDPKNGQPFIGTWVDNPKAHCGACGPMESIEEAIGWFRKKMEEMEHEKDVSLDEEVEHE